MKLFSFVVLLFASTAQAVDDSDAHAQIFAAMMGGEQSEGDGVDISALMNQGHEDASTAEDAINAALMAGQSAAESEAIGAAMQAQKQTEGDVTSVIGEGACMGGYVKDLSLYADCERILGFLSIVNIPDGNLDKLKKLKVIEWADGLKGPQGNGLLIANNTLLENLNGLSELSAVAGGLTIEWNPKLTSLLGIGENLKQVGVNDLGNSVAIRHNELLNDLGRSWDFWEGKVTGTLSIEENAMLAQIKGFSGVFTIGGGLQIMGNNNLQSLDGLEHVRSIGADAKNRSLHIVNNANLRTLTDLRGLQGALTGALEVAKNTQLRNLDGLQSVLSLGKDVNGVSVKLSDNPALSDTSGLSGISKVEGSIVIMFNPSLAVLAGLQKIADVPADMTGNSLIVQSNQALTNLLGFSGIGEVSGAISIERNPSLASLDGLQNLKAIHGKNKFGNSLEVISNGQLKNVAALSGLNNHLNGLVIRGNPQLHDVASINGVASATTIVVEDVQCVSIAEAAELKKKATKKADVKEATTTASCATTLTTLVQKTSVGHGRSNICGGTTSDAAWHVWEMFGSTGLYTDVDTSACKFTDAQPRYMASVMGDTAHWQLTGVNSIYSASQNSFRVYMWHPVLRGKFMQYFADRYNWRLNWLVDSGKTSGITTGGNSGWTQLPSTKNVLFIDVNTKKSGFSKTPRYITSIHGGRDHWKVQGIHSVYEPSATGFRIFCVFPTEISATFAEEQKWRIAWIGSNDDRVSGTSGQDWMVYTPSGRQSSDHPALFIDVDASAGAYKTVPTYVTALTGRTHHWMVTGAGSIYSATKSGFRIYLDKAQSTKAVQSHDWRINYIAYSKPVNCVVSQWAAWTQCSLTCGSGKQYRTRTIATRSYYGGTCLDALEEERQCETQPCPVDCVMNEWTNWGGCDVTCATGQKHRSRTVRTEAAHGGVACLVATGETETSSTACDMGPCPVHCEVSDWGSFTPCTKTCGTGRRTRTRTVTTKQLHGGDHCPALVDTPGCNTKPCPVDCELNQWGAWLPCSVTCGWGTKMRKREIVRHSKWGGKNCGAEQQPAPCHTGACPIDCSFSSWHNWGNCDRTCGRGTKTRSRTIHVEAQHDGTACPATEEVVECNSKPCPVDCVVSKWFPYGSCSTTCGGGIKNHTRIVVQPPAYGGKSCGALTDSQPCNTQPCPVDCEPEAWGEWSSCSLSCGAGGTRTRTRGIRIPMQHGGVDCNGHGPKLSQTQACDLGPCPVHCQTTTWSVWGGCSKTCGTGTQKRTRHIIVHAEFSGYTCPALEQIRQCNEDTCPVDCVQSAWGDGWSQCTTSCGGGKQQRTRAVLLQPAHGGKICGPSTQSRKCNTQHCPVDCQVATWSNFGPCSKTCGEGVWVRTRVVKRYASFGGEPCPPFTEEGVCNEGPCPVNCEVSSWEPWGPCSRTCGRGFRERVRHITREARHGGTVCPWTDERQECNSDDCPIDCSLSQWSSYGACSVSCGGGLKKRTRAITVWPQFGGSACGPLSSKVSCNEAYCPIDCQVSHWSQWGSCSTTCEKGEQQRSRYAILDAAFGGNKCPQKEQTRNCNEYNPCPKHCTVSKWGDWGVCSATCGEGSQRRARTITAHANHGGYSCPNLEGSRVCNTAPCPVDCVLSDWGSWKPFIRGGAKVRRMRQIVRAPLFGGKECEHRKEYKEYTKDAAMCNTNTYYGKWSECTKQCGSGVRYRFREHVICSESAVVKYHMKFRQGERCNTQNCADGSSGKASSVIIPEVSGGLFPQTAQAATLDEELREQRIY